jgi:hypothetical protein
MSMPCLPSYAGYWNVWLLAAQRQQTLAKACQLAVPQLADLPIPSSSAQADASHQHDVSAEELQPALPSAADAATDAGRLALAAAAAPGSTYSSSSAGSSAWADTLEFAQQYGCYCEPLPQLMASMPRSKTEKAATKQAIAVVKAKIEPAACDLAHPGSCKKPRSNPCKPPAAAVDASDAERGLQGSTGGAAQGHKGSSSLAVGLPCSPASRTAASTAAGATAAAPLLQEVTKLHLLAFSCEAENPQHVWAGAAVDLEAPVLLLDAASVEFAGAAAATAVAGTAEEDDVSSAGCEAVPPGQPTLPTILTKVRLRDFSCKVQRAYSVHCMPAKHAHRLQPHVQAMQPLLK